MLWTEFHSLNGVRTCKAPRWSLWTKGLLGSMVFFSKETGASPCGEGILVQPSSLLKVTPCTLAPKLPTIPPSLLSVASGSKRSGQRLAQFWREKNLWWSKQRWWQVSSFSELKLFKCARPGSTTITANADSLPVTWVLCKSDKKTSNVESCNSCRVEGVYNLGCTKMFDIFCTNMYKGHFCKKKLILGAFSSLEKMPFYTLKNKGKA